MYTASKNQLGNVDNPHQGRAKRVLCVCSAGLLRSPSLANVLHKELEYNTRACGTAQGFALIPLTEALIWWAEEIVFVDEECMDYMTFDAVLEVARREHPKENFKKIVLNVPDNYDYGDEELESILFKQYMETN